MKINFKETKEGMENEIFLNGKQLGAVVLNVWNGKWSLSPTFNINNVNKKNLDQKYDSGYKAGKALVSLYLDAKVLESFDDTQEYDVRGYLFNKWGP